MSALIGLAYSLSATLALVGAVEQGRLDGLVKLSRQIETGATKSQVAALLGPPIAQWENAGLFWSTGPQWVYGTVVDLDHIVNVEATLPEALPIKFRLFGAYESDLVINWSDEDTVALITRPAETRASLE